MAVNPPEFSVQSRIVVVPTELISNHPDPNWILRLDILETVCSLRPERKGKTEKQNRLKNRHPNLKVSRDVVLHSVVGSLGVSLPPESPAREQEKPRPPYKEREHEPVNKIDQVVHTSSMFRKIFRDT